MDEFLTRVVKHKKFDERTSELQDVEALEDQTIYTFRDGNGYIKILYRPNNYKTDEEIEKMFSNGKPKPQPEKEATL